MWPAGHEVHARLTRRVACKMVNKLQRETQQAVQEAAELGQAHDALVADSTTLRAALKLALLRSQQGGDDGVQMEMQLAEVERDCESERQARSQERHARKRAQDEVRLCHQLVPCDRPFYFSVCTGKPCGVHSHEGARRRSKPWRL